MSEIRACELCAASLPHGPRPVLQASARAPILIAGQAPGRKVHASGKPFDDASGERLRAWLGVTPAQFYDPRLVSIVPMGFCYPGSGTSGDLPPRKECRDTWHDTLLPLLGRRQLTLVLGQYAQAYHLAGKRRSVTAAVADWRSTWPGLICLPHPSPRNIRWFRANPWFEAEVVPVLQARVAKLVGREPST